MLKITIKDILDNSKAKLLNGSLDEEIKECFVDSNKVTKGSCFFGIMGNKVNGSLFYKEALKRGAKIIVINKIYDLDLKGYADRCVIICDNVLKTLQDIAAYKISLFTGPVIGVTGSVGKTSTKNMIVDVLKKKYKVLTNKGNENSQVGLPLSILRLMDEDVMVLEMGMSKKSEMHNLSMIVKPNISVITNIGDSHIEYFDSKEDILNAKLEILDGMNCGMILLNNDDELLRNLSIYNKDISVITYGIKNKSDVFATNIFIDNNISFDACGINDIKLNYSYNYIYNALISIKIGKLLNVKDDDIKYAINNFKNERHRLETIKLNNNITLIDDSYNASLESVKEALEYLNRISGRKIVILGDLLELGKHSKEIHNKIGDIINKSNIDKLITIGKYSKYIGKKNKHIWLKHFKDETKSRNYIRDILKENDVILIKGSNGINLINIVEYLKEGLDI